MNMTPDLQRRLARQIAETTGVEVRCGSAVAVSTHEEREAFHD